MSFRNANITGMLKQIYREPNRSGLPFRLIGIAEEEERMKSIVELARRNQEVGVGLMLRDPGHRPERVRALASRALWHTLPPNLSLIANGCDVEGIPWTHLPGVDLRRRASLGTRPVKPFGCSVHSCDETRLAETLKPDYLLLSPIFPTVSKLGIPALGLTALRECSEGTAVPIVALGGITSTKCVRECLDAGAFGVAGVSLFDQANASNLQRVVDLLKERI